MSPAIVARTQRRLRVVRWVPGLTEMEPIVLTLMATSWGSGVAGDGLDTESVPWREGRYDAWSRATAPCAAWPKAWLTAG